MPAEVTERLEAAVLIALPDPEAPIEPVPEVRLTLVAVRVPEVSVMALAALSAIVPIVPVPAITLPARVILPLLVVTRLNVSPLPAAPAVRETELALLT
ncbi:MAG: hypothetical protein WDN66_04690 [Candidatus Saccharibacteria bacterium]